MKRRQTMISKGARRKSYSVIPAIFLVLLLCSCEYFIEYYDKNEVYERPELSTAQMYEDFDYLSRIVTEVCPFINVNKILFDLEMPALLAAYRAEIESAESDVDFYRLVSKAVGSMQSHHLDIYYSPSYLLPETSIDSAMITSDFYWTSFYDSYGMEKGESFVILNFPGLYTNGTYYTNFDLSIFSPSIPKYSILREVDGMDVHTFINDELYFMPYMKWDPDFNHFYKLYFTNYLFLYLPGSHTFTFETPESETLSLTIDTNRLTKEQLDEWKGTGWNFSWGQNPNYFENYKTLYIKLQFMDRRSVREIIKELKEIVPGKVIDRIIVDIRNNPGGNDYAWHDLLSFLLKEDIQIEGSFGIKDSSLLRDKLRVGSERDLLKGEKKSYTFLNNEDFLVTDFNSTISIRKDSLAYEGKIYIVTDNIYSSAGSFADIALQHDQLILVGRPTHTHLGKGITPIFYTLPNSLINVRIEPVIDLSNSTTAPDILHDEVEVLVELTADEEFAVYEYGGDLLSEEYLFTYDPFIKKVIGISTE